MVDIDDKYTHQVNTRYILVNDGYSVSYHHRNTLTVRVGKNATWIHGRIYNNVQMCFSYKQSSTSK